MGQGRLTQAASGSGLPGGRRTSSPGHCRTSAHWLPLADTPTAHTQQDPCSRLPSRSALYLPAGKGRIVPPHSGRFFIIMCHHRAGGTARVAYRVLRGGEHRSLSIIQGARLQCGRAPQTNGHSVLASGTQRRVTLAGLCGPEQFCGLRTLLHRKQHRLAGHRPSLPHTSAGVCISVASNGISAGGLSPGSVLSLDMWRCQCRQKYAVTGQGMTGGTVCGGDPLVTEGPRTLLVGTVLRP